VTVKNILKKCLNTRVLNLDSCFKIFLYVSKEDKGVLQKEVEILGLVHVDELGDDFKIQEFNNLF